MNNNKYFYKVYGLDILSEIEIPEFIKAKKINNNDKVTISKGIMPIKIKQDINLGKSHQISKDEIWFNIDNVATYRICNGDKIIFETHKNADLDEVKIFLMCSCLGLLMIQRGKIAIHGGSTIINNKAIIITGDRGAGKSTLTSALRLKRYKFLCDDISAISFNNNMVNVNYGYPYQKLCTSAMHELQYNIDKYKYKSLMGDTEIKYMIPAKEEFIARDMQLDAIFQLVCDDVKDVCIEEIKGVKKFNSIISCIYRGEFLKYMEDISSDYLKQCVEIAKNIKMYKIVRPKNKFTLDDQVKLIESKLY